jgi:hypothetical protein
VVKNEHLTPDCQDNSAEFRLTIAPDSKLPAGTHINGDFPSGQRYFRLEILAALYELDEGKCNYVSRSDVRTQVTIEGSFNAKDLSMTPLTCGNSKTLGQSSLAVYTLMKTVPQHIITRTGLLAVFRAIRSNTCLPMPVWNCIRNDRCSG